MSAKQCELCLGFDVGMAEVLGLKACSCDTKPNAQPSDKPPQDVEPLYRKTVRADGSFLFERCDELPERAEPSDQDFEDKLEAAYWQFDSRRRGLTEWKGLPQSERDAFKNEVRTFLASLQPKQSNEGLKEQTVVAIAFELAEQDGYDTEDKHGGLYDLKWSGGAQPEPEGDVLSLVYLPRAEKVYQAIAALGSKNTVGTIGHVHPSKAGLAESLLRHKQSNEGLAERLRAAQKMISLMCYEGRPPKMSIPARPDHDEDLLISATLRDAIAALQGEKG